MSNNITVDNYNTLSHEEQINFLISENFNKNLIEEAYEKIATKTNKIKQEPRYDEKGEIIGYDNVVSKKTIGVDGWRRIMLLDMINVYEKLGNKKIDILNFIIENVKDNLFTMNHTQVAKETKIGRNTVIEVFKILKNLEILKQNPNGIGYVLNPVIFGTYGSNSKQNRLIVEYKYDDYKPIRKHNGQKYQGKSLKEKEQEIFKIANNNKE